MQYRKFGNTGIEVSALGFGTMRFPTIKEEQGTIIDEDQAIGMLRLAIDQGVNYIDTAYPYHEGMSEVIVGKALKDGYRERTLLATKCPPWSITKAEDFNKILDEQLTKLQTDHIDFYLLHALNTSYYEDVILKFGLIEKMEEAKAAGKIRFIGFSFHDEYPVFKRIIDSYSKWDFCQIQLNYIDTHNQAGIKGLEYAAQKGLGIVIMEPLLGGKLAIPPRNVAAALSNDKLPVEWALDYLWNRPEVGTILSGMSDLKQTEDNLTYADRSSIAMLTDKDLSMLEQAKKIFDTMALVPCTKCRYCMPCPFNLDIPKIFEAYNLSASSTIKEAKTLYASLETVADSCQKCRQCEKECPQHIVISEMMGEAAALFA